MRVFGRAAKHEDIPGDPLELLFRGPDLFSGFTLVDLKSDLDDLVGVDVELVSNHPDNGGPTMDFIRASAVPLEHVLGPDHGLSPIGDSGVEPDASNTTSMSQAPERPVDPPSILVFDPAADDPPDLTAFFRHARAYGCLLTVQIVPKDSLASATNPRNDDGSRPHRQ